MRSLIKFFLLFSIFFVISGDIISQVKVKGYYRKDGTYVQPHYRSNPDGNPYNNWSYPGNTNPYTGKTATGNESTYLDNYYNKNTKNSYNNHYGSNYSSSNYSFQGTGNIIIYTNDGDIGEVIVFVDDEYIGTLDKYFTFGKPSEYGDDGTVSISVEGGYHKVEAISSSGTCWSGSVPVYGDVNNLLRLTK